jgi:hypothetical protein
MSERTLEGVASNPVVLWETDQITCICQRHTADRIELRLIASGTVIEREFFAEAESASNFALDKMRAYRADSPALLCRMTDIQRRGNTLS